MKRKTLIISLSIAVLIICAMAAVMTGCNAKGDEYADLVAIRINNHMAEWVDSSYNFDYKGVGELNVTVPYTNYLEINDLIVSPKATAMVYEDEACTQELKEKDYYIYIDINKTLYVKVINNKKSNIYKVNVTVKQTNLPDNVDLSVKDYDNRGGHVYIPDSVKQVSIDGEDYYVLDRLEWYDCENISNAASQRYILSSDSRCSHFWKFGSDIFNGIFDGNGYMLYVERSINEKGATNLTTIKEIGENGVFRNFTLAATSTFNYNSDTYAGYEVWNNKIAVLCNENYGTIDNVCNSISLMDSTTRFAGDTEEEYVHRLAIYADVNRGVISNCLNKGSIVGEESDIKIRQFSIFANEMHGEQYDYTGSAKLINCVNTGNIEYNTTASNDYHNSGVYLIATNADAYVQLNEVYNVGRIQKSNNKKKYGRYFLNASSVNANGKSRDVDCSRIKDYTK
ncbi:MAG: hypothetical protein K2M44_03710 [Clostridia bacterium]|nr:hypothetical protein [Clostridia bacterium]